MPIYEYVCDSCEIRFELIRSIKESDTSAPCTKCGGLQTHRALTTCFAHTNSGSTSGYSASHSSGGCGGCNGGSCGSCHH